MTGHSLPWGFRWRSSAGFVLATVALGLFTDLFLYGIIVPVLPFLLHDRLGIPDDRIQLHASVLLAVYAGTSVVFSFPAGWVTDRIGSRRQPFLAGLMLLLAATGMLAFGRTVGVLALARALQGVSAAIVWTAGLAMVQDVVGPRNIGQAIGMISSVISVGELIAPVLGGVLYGRAGMSAVSAVSIGILAIDLVMRLLVIDPKSIRSHEGSDFCHFPPQDSYPRMPGQQAPEAREDDPLLPRPASEEYKIHATLSSMEQAIPILYCFRNPRFLTAMLLVSVQSLLIGVFDATVPTETEKLFHFRSLKVGLLFVAIVIPNLALGPVAGLAVDRYGTKVVASAGYAFLVPCFALLGLPSQKILTGEHNVILFCVILGLNGVGLSMIASPGLVEASHVTERYESANPGFFGENGPYAQLYGLSSVFAFAGLAVGPLVSGMLREGFGYGVMAGVFAVVAGMTAVVSFVRIGEKRR